MGRGYVFDPTNEEDAATHLIEINPPGNYIRIVTIGKDDKKVNNESPGTMYQTTAGPEEGPDGKTRIVYFCDRIWVPQWMADRLTDCKNVVVQIARLLAVRSVDDALADPFTATKTPEAAKKKRRRKPAKTAAEALEAVDGPESKLAAE